MNIDDLLISIKKIFMRYGIKSVTMDDIARELKMSKKTLYNYVTDKSDLVTKVMKQECQEDETCVCNIVKHSKNAIDETLEIVKHMTGKVASIHPSIHYDLEKYYPEAWQIFQEHKRRHVMGTIMKNLSRGMKEGFYRKDLNPDIIARVFVARLDIIFDGDLFPPAQFNFGDVYVEYMRYHLRGILSEKGMKYISQLEKKIK